MDCMEEFEKQEQKKIKIFSASRGLGENEEEIITRNKRVYIPRSSTTITLSLEDQELNSAFDPDTIKHKFEESKRSDTVHDN